MSDVSVSVLERADDEAWDEFVRSTPDGTFFHLSGWRDVIEEAFGHKTYYLLARRDGAIVGVLPLTAIRSAIFGHSLLSNAFSVYGGALACDHEAYDKLVAECVRLGRELKLSYVEFRANRIADRSWVCREGLYVTFRRQIYADVEANMKAIPRKQRAMVRKGIANGLVSRLDKDVENLHEIYARSVHQLGTPVFSKRYFALLKAKFSDSCDVLTVFHHERPIASVMNFYFRDEVLPYYGGGTAAARALAGNDFMYWEVMRRACERGCKLFDFGRSKIGTGSYDFKRYWGFEPTPLSYQYLSLDNKALPANNPLNPKFQLMIAVWRRLPFFLTKIAGPQIVKSIG
jgi:FemAB-related protein (PEP-CTERM system-associated)